MVGRVTKCHLDPMRYDRNQPYLAVEYKMELTAHVQVIERATGKVVANLGNLTGETIFRTQSDLSSTKRDAMPMAAYKLALQVVSNTVGSW